MKKTLFRRPSPSLVISLIALFVALGGTGYAAAKLNGKNIKNKTISGAKLKNKTITGGKLKNRTLGVTKLSKGAVSSLKGGTGPAGPTGPTGAAGSSLAFANVAADGTVDAANSKNVTTANVKNGTGFYCISGVAGTVRNAVASLSFDTSSISGSGGSIRAFVGAGAGCPAGTQVSVATDTNGGGGLEDHTFTVIID
jgi:hypothetical protein